MELKAEDVFADTANILQNYFKLDEIQSWAVVFEFLLPTNTKLKRLENGGIVFSEASPSRGNSIINPSDPQTYICLWVPLKDPNDPKDNHTHLVNNSQSNTKDCTNLHIAIRRAKNYNNNDPSTWSDAYKQAKAYIQKI